MNTARIQNDLPGQGDLNTKLRMIVASMNYSTKRACFREIARQLIHSNPWRPGFRPQPGQGSSADVARNLVSEIEAIARRNVP